MKIIRDDVQQWTSKADDDDLSPLTNYRLVMKIAWFYVSYILPVVIAPLPGKLIGKVNWPSETNWFCFFTMTKYTRIANKTLIGVNLYEGWYHEYIS